MSADNWAICPRCKTRAEKEYNEKAAVAGAMYGNAPPKEYMTAIAQLKPPRIEETLREYYELGIENDGVFCVSYRAVCACGFEFSYEHEEEAT